MRGELRVGRLLLPAFLVAAGLVVVGPATAAYATTLPAGFSEVTVGAGMNSPTTAAYAPDGRVFVAEKGGRVRVVTASGSLVSTPLYDLRDKVNSHSDRGLLGLAVDTDFASNHWLYLLYTAELKPGTPDSGDPMTSRLTRVTVNADNTLQNPGSPETTILGRDGAAPCPSAP